MAGKADLINSIVDPLATLESFEVLPVGLDAAAADVSAADASWGIDPNGAPRP